MNSDGSYFYKNECYKLADVPEIKEFIKKYKLKSYWHEKTYEWFLFNDSFFQILMYTDWDSPIINFCYKAENKIRKYDAIFEIYGVEESKSRDISLNAKNKIESLGYKENIVCIYHFVSMMEKIEEFFPSLPNNEAQYKKLFDKVNISEKVKFYFCDDRMRQVGIDLEQC